MSSVRKFLHAKALRCIALALSVIASLTLLSVAYPAPPRIDYIIRTNVNKVDVHFGAEANRSYTLQAVISMGCSNGPCNMVASNSWTNLLVVPASPLPTNHYIYRDVATNRTRFYRLRATP